MFGRRFLCACNCARIGQVEVEVRPEVQTIPMSGVSSNVERIQKDLSIVFLFEVSGAHKI